MDELERQDLAETLLGVSRALLAVAVRTVAAVPPGLTVVQHRVLVLVSEAGTLSVGAVAHELGVDQSTASRHCARLEAWGLLLRSRAAHDGRSVDVSLTPAGRRQVRAVHAARRAEVLEILDRMPDADARAAVSALRCFHEAAHQPADQASR
jgi:DNA-binding MarR family transcriptional regulator